MIATMKIPINKAIIKQNMKGTKVLIMATIKRMSQIIMDTSISRKYLIKIIFRQNSSNFYNKMQTNYSNKEADSLENGWGSRYARRTMNWNYIWEEDKKILDEHLDQIRKKKCI